MKNCQMVEKEVHDLLAQYRIRADREFFKIEYSKACSLIEDYLKIQVSFIMMQINFLMNLSLFFCAMCVSTKVSQSSRQAFCTRRRW